MNRIGLAFRSFFAILFTGKLPVELAQAFGFTPKTQPAAKPAPQAKPQDGALQILGILQRDSRLIDFLMEDLSAYSDQQVGAAARTVHDQCRDSLNRHLRLAPVIDAVEGVFTKVDSNDVVSVKLLGNVPVSGKAPGGLLRHKGWRAEKIDLPALTTGVGATVIAPAEVEIE
ncbi:MAG TPA: DUF2760 domain-containing protein [Bryobacteraceae bacterium]|nr:DUF2760 domain-containing protein [Bryobacteraceae bacterium]